MKTIRKISQLQKLGLIKAENVKDIEKVAENFSVALPAYLIDTINSETPENQAALLKQFLPTEAELNIMDVELNDPIGDKPHTAVKGVVHRHRDRCLLMPITACPVYCRFCFRREKVGLKTNALTKNELKAAYTYIGQHKEIWEVILTGGDPLILKAKTLQAILFALEAIEHVEVIRIHTRVPVMDPVRVNAEMIKALKIKKTVYVVLHTNHPSELTKAAQEACALFIDNGIPMLSQSVLLKGVNDNLETMGALMRSLVKNRIKPYYLHHADLAVGTSHFRTSIQEGQVLLKSLRAHYSGLCQPTYVLDIPGGYGKVPIGYHYLAPQKCSSGAPQHYWVEDHHAELHDYQGEQ